MSRDARLLEWADAVSASSDQTPHRVQLSRRKGWRMPPDTVKVSRPTKWGNPFTVSQKMNPGSKVGGAMGYYAVPTVEDAVECYRLMLAAEGPRASALREDLHELRGKNLACWCPLDQPCHADMLLEIANE
jgi:hypothetical protein